VRTLAVLILLCTLTATARAEVPELPERPIAYYRLDPSGFNPPSAWLPAFLRLLDAVGVVPRSELPVADGILIASTLGSYEHRFALIDLKAHRYNPGELQIDYLHMGLTIEAPGQFPQLKQSLATILSHYGNPAAREQTEIELPGNRKGVRFRLNTWPSWWSIEWYGDGQRLHVGIGHGALERWLRIREGQADPRVSEHKKVAGHDVPGSFFEVFADLDRLHAAAPTLFHTGRLSPMLRLFELGDTDVAMLHGRWAETFLVLDLTTQEAGKVAHTSLSLDRWPEDAGIPRPPGRFHVAAPIDWSAATRRVLGAVGVILDPDDRAAFDRAMDGYAQQTGVDLVNYTRHFRPYLLVSDYPKSWLPIPGTATVYFVLKPGPPEGVDAAKSEAHFDALMKPLLAPKRRAGDELGVVRDEPTGVHWLDSPLRGMFKAPAWGWADHGGTKVLIGSFSPQAVLENRAWLAK
jgi:hypothetical protein